MSQNTNLNKAYFNDVAANYDSKYEPTLLQLRDAMRSRLGFIGGDWVTVDSSQDKTVRLLDYACGTGSISRALAPYVTHTVGVDLSPNMVAAYTARAREEGIPADRMSAIQGNILDDGQEEEGASPSAGLLASHPLLATPFDIAAVGLGAHHFDDPALVARRLVDRLRPGGVLFISDLVGYEMPKPNEGENEEGEGIITSDGGHGHEHGHAHHHHHHDHEPQHDHHEHGHVHGDQGSAGVFGKAYHTITRHGFSEAQMKELFEQAGAGKGFAFELVEEVQMPHFGFGDENRRTVFFARGTKE